METQSTRQRRQLVGDRDRTELLLQEVEQISHEAVNDISLIDFPNGLEIESVFNKHNRQQTFQRIHGHLHVSSVTFNNYFHGSGGFTHHPDDANDVALQLRFHEVEHVFGGVSNGHREREAHEAGRLDRARSGEERSMKEAGELPQRWQHHDDRSTLRCSSARGECG